MKGHKNLYTYDASGKKLKVINYSVRDIINVPIGSISSLPDSSRYTKLTTDYVGNIIYENGVLKEILLPEGYWQNGVFYYYLKDHLGNNRVTINSSGAPVERSHYYPSGMRFYPESTSNSAALPYRYNGKELEAMNGLNQMDYGARRRSSGLPIWTGRDILSEKYYSISPYVYCAGNPIIFVDPDGRWIKLSEAIKYNSSASEVLTKRGISNGLRGAFKDILSTPDGYAFFAQFAKEGDRIAGHTFTKDGELSNKTLNVIDYSFSEENGNLIPSSDAGSISVDLKTGTVTLNMFTYQLNNKEEIAETVAHETQDHGYKVKDALAGKNITNADQDHKALRDKNTNHKGYKQYKSIQKQLEKNDDKYKNEYKKSENNYRDKYKDIQ